LIVDDSPDFILLSDTRLNSNCNNYGLHDIVKQFSFRGYSAIFNSPKSNRGVGILIKKALNPVILAKKECSSGNFLLLKLTISGYSKEFVVGSIYGPNDNNMTFFDNLDAAITEMGHCTKIIGGDWNLTLDDSPVDTNLDCLNMQNLPSKKRTDRLLNLCSKFALFDPYRMLYPDKREFTYVPNDPELLNRSRIDFFTVSSELATKITNSKIHDSVVRRIFDHKKITFSTSKKKKRNPNNILKNEVLRNPETVNKVQVTIIEFFIQHVNRDTMPAREIKSVLEQCGYILHKIKEINDLKMNLALEGNAPEKVDRINYNREDIEVLLSRLPNIEQLNSLESNCEPDSFFETLVMTIKNETLSEQAMYFKTKAAKKRQLISGLRQLKANNPENTNDIFKAERELSAFLEQEIREEIIAIKNFERLNNEKMTPYFLRVAKDTTKPPESNSICDDNGEEFKDDSTRDNHITGFYKDLYTEPRKGIIVTQDDIRAFLGDTVDKQEVKDSILTEDEKEDLDKDLTIDEFDTAVKQTKKNTAPGIDGISYSFFFTHIFQI